MEGEGLLTARSVIEFFDVPHLAVGRRVEDKAAQVRAASYHVQAGIEQDRREIPGDMPGSDSYPRTVRLRTFIRPMTCSVALLVQGTCGCQSMTRWQILSRTGSLTFPQQ